jgi:DNA-3-methyladenine glycosylase
MTRTPGRISVQAFCDRPPLELARALLGCHLVSTVGGARTDGIIVETEAYGGPEDPASHASTISGRTQRNRAMFGPPGTAYVYLSYGVHWCLNVVAGPDGTGGAVLVRGMDPVTGERVMRRRRRGRSPIGAGPGRLAQALGVTGDLYGHDLARSPLVLVPGALPPEAAIGTSGRVGVSRAADWPHRLYVRGAPGCSKPDGWNPVAP